MGIKSLLLPVAMLGVGAGVGGGAAVATQRVLGPPPPHDAAAAAAEAARAPGTFVPVRGMLAPLVMGDGRLSGYVTFDFDVEVPADQAATVTEKLPLLLHAINMRTYRTPLAAGPDGMLPDIGGLRALVLDAAPEAFGKGVVRRVAVTKSEPA